MAPRVAIKIDLDKRNAESGFKSLAASAKTSFTEINQGLELASKAFAVVSRVISSVVSVTSAWVKASAESELAQTRLARASGEHYASLTRLNQTLLRKIGIDDDETAALETKLLALGVLPSKLEGATKATLGLATATGKDMTRAALEVARAFQKGGVEAERLERLFAITEASSRTFAGETRKLDTAFGELGESLGDSITKSEALKGAMSALTESVHAFTDIVGSPELQAAIDVLFRSLVSWAADAIDAIVGLRRALGDLRGFIASSAIGEIPGLREIFDVSGLIREQDLSPTFRALEELSDRLRIVADARREAFVGPPAPGQALALGKSGARPRRARGARGIDESQISPEGQAILGRESITAMDEEITRARQQAFEAEKDLERRQQKELLDLEIESNEMRFAAELEAMERREKLQTQHLEATHAFQSELSQIGITGITDFISGIVSNALQGELDLGAAIGRLMGGMLQALGRSLVALGSAAVAAGVLGSVAPIFAPSTGGPAGIAAGLGLIAAGSVLSGVGAAIGAGSAPRAGARASTAGGGTSFAAGAEPRGFVPRQDQAPRTTVINVSFGRGFVTGSPRAIGREIRRYLEEAETLRPSARARFAGG